MLAKTGLLVLSNPKHISRMLVDVQKKVTNTLYIQLLSALADPVGAFHSNVFNTPPMLSRTIFCIYSQATKLCNNLDVRVLLSGIKSNVPQIHTQKPIDVIIFDKKYSTEDINNFIKNKVPNVTEMHSVLTVDCGDDEITCEKDERDCRMYKHICLGGTFDRLHAAHKLLLSDSILRAKEKLTIGVTEENMTHNKILCELIEDVDTRIQNVKSFVTEICPELNYNICTISDPFGPAIVDPTMDVIVVSEETVKGGEKINEIRKDRNLKGLHIVPIPFIDEPHPQIKEETKVSSSNARLRLLGTLLKPVEKKDIPNKPYVIGLTGGIASGKSGIASHLKNLGVPIIDCDKLGHKMYVKDGACYQKVIDQFESEIVTPEGEIDRRALGNIVFKDPDEMQKLNAIMWPAMAEEVKNIIRDTKEDVVCVDAAILCLAGWDAFCHEVWTTFIPRSEAIERLKNRNNLTEDQAKSRLASQPSNKDYISKANVIFCTLWEVEYTKSQVHKAWELLKSRLFA